MYFTIRVLHSGTFETHRRSRRRSSVSEYLKESRSIIDPSSIDELLLLFDFVARPARKCRNDANLFPWLSFLSAITRRTSLALVPIRHGRFAKRMDRLSVCHLFRKRASSRGNFLRENHREHRVPADVQRNDVIARHALTYVIFVALAFAMKKIVKPRRDSFTLRNIQRHQLPRKRASILTAIRHSRFAVSLER